MDRASQILNDEAQRMAFTQLSEALQIIPISEKEALTEALTRIPVLVEIESNPLSFLRRENFNAWNAAKRLAVYWQQRKEIFGERCFLPMSLTGDGAMDPDDVAAFSVGYYHVLPDHVSGKAAIYYDRSGIRMLPIERRSRVAFYAWHVMSEHPKAADEGVLCLGSIESLTLDESNRRNLYFILNGFHANISAIHIFCTPDEAATVNVFAIFASLAIRVMGRAVFQRTSVYADPTREQRREKLISMGFRPEGLPERFGGIYTHDTLLRWIEERRQLEFRRYAGMLRSHTDERLSAFLGESNLARLVMSARVRQAAELQLRSQWRTLGTGISVQPMLQGRHLSPSFASRSEPLNTNTNLQQLLQQRAADMSSASLNPSIRNARDQAVSNLLGIENTPIPTGQRNSGVEVLVPPAAASLPTYEEDSNSPKVQAASNSDLFQEESKMVKQSIVAALDNEINQISMIEKKAYMEAMNKAPLLFKNESDPIRFVRAENYDIRAAAYRMVHYWEKRKELFGSRAFLPMTQTGNGALTRDDVVILSSGSIAVLPKDSGNRSVILSDRSRMLEISNDSIKSRLRSLFYLLSVLSEDETNQKEGCVLIGVLVTPRVADLLNNYTEASIEIQRIAPIKLKAGHFIICPPKTGKKTVVEAIISSVAGPYERCYGPVICRQNGNSPKEILEKLKRCGLAENALPPVAGGTWKYEEFTKWQRHRNQYEQAMETGSEEPDMPEMARPSEKIPTNLTEKEKKERKRKLNIIHSRQKRERRRAEMEGLKEQSATLKEANDALKEDNQRLEAMLKSAQEKVVMIEKGVAVSGPAKPTLDAARTNEDTWERQLSTLLVKQPSASQDSSRSLRGEQDNSETQQQLLAQGLLFNSLQNSAANSGNRNLEASMTLLVDQSHHSPQARTELRGVSANNSSGVAAFLRYQQQQQNKSQSNDDALREAIVKSLRRRNG